MHTQTDKTSPLLNRAWALAQSQNDLGSFNADAWRSGDPTPEVIREAVGGFEIVDRLTAGVAHEIAIESARRALVEDVDKGAIEVFLIRVEENGPPRLVLAYNDMQMFLVVDENDMGAVLVSDESRKSFSFEFQAGRHLREQRTELLERVPEEKVVKWHAIRGKSSQAEKAGPR